MFDAIVGDMLGDGYINRGKLPISKSKHSRLEFTFSVVNLPYLKHLKFNI